MFYTKHKKLLVALVFLCVVSIAGIFTKTVQAAGTPTDYNKNYIYDLQSGNTCLDGDFVEYASFVSNADPTKVTGNNPFACIRLKRNEPLGYTTSPAVTNQPLINNCSPNYGGGSSSIVYHLVAGMGWVCVSEIDANQWGKTLYETPYGTPGRAELDTDCTDGNLSKDNCEIIKWIVKFTNVLAGIVGIVVVIMIIIGGIQYSSAGSDSQKIASAKSKITNALFALLVFIFLYAFLQWLVPGGVF